MYRHLTAFIVLFVWLVPTPALAAHPEQFEQPIQGTVVKDFLVGSRNWEPGHRGVDLAGSPGDAVRAAAAGTVIFAGRLVDRELISIDHGDRRTTYEPVMPVVANGARVEAGQLIGLLRTGHSGCSTAACLHWGLIGPDGYLNPMRQRRTPITRLLPTESERHYAQQPIASAPDQQGKGEMLTWPAQGRPGSPFGMRMHPILRYQRMHWGTDIGAPCGSPLLAAADGTVRQRSANDGHGNRLILDIGAPDGVQTQVGYSHAAGYIVGTGQTVRRGQVIGYVGSTGLSTGCHLHLELWRNGTRVNPMSVFVR